MIGKEKSWPKTGCVDWPTVTKNSGGRILRGAVTQLKNRPPEEKGRVDLGNQLTWRLRDVVPRSCVFGRDPVAIQKGLEKIDPIPVIWGSKWLMEKKKDGGRKNEGNMHHKQKRDRKQELPSWKLQRAGGGRPIRQEKGTGMISRNRKNAGCRGRGARLKRGKKGDACVHSPLEKLIAV